jgi:hypothetical protein
VSDNIAPEISFVGGLVYPTKGSPLARGRLSWPFARLTLSDDSVTLGARGLLNKVVPPVTVMYAELARVEWITGPLSWAYTLKLHSSSADADGLAFSSWRSTVAAAVHRLRVAGVSVE